LNKNALFQKKEAILKQPLVEYKALKINKDSNGKEIWEPIRRGYLKNKLDIEILNQYNSEIVGLYNYYRIANNVSLLHRFKYVMEYSIYKTFAAKYKSTVRKIRRKFNSNGKFAVRYTSKKVLISFLSIMMDLKEKTLLQKIKILIKYLCMENTLYLKV